MILYIHIGGEKDSFCVKIYIYIHIFTYGQSHDDGPKLSPSPMFALELELPNSGSGR